MATNFGYVKQGADSQVNWGQVGKTFTDMLSAENTRRETLKTEIDTNTVTDLEKLSNIPKGSSEEYNKWTTDAADKISQARLLQVKELKAGRLSLKDYNNYRQNTVSGVNNMVSTIKSYNAWFDNGMKRAEKMESGAAELWKNSLLESMKFKDTVPNIGLDGSMSVTKQVMNPKTGLMEVSSNPADAFSFSSMLDFGKKQFDRFKAAESLDGLSKTVGEYTKALNQGNVGLVQDIWQTDKSGKYTNPQIGAIQNQVKSSISNPNNAMSVLVDFKGVTPSGGKYEFTNDPNDPKLKGANRDNVIFMDSTMSPQLTEGQMKRAEDIMIEGLKARSGHVETAFEKRAEPRYASGTTTDAQLKAEAERRNKIGYVKDIEVAQVGTPAEAEAVLKDRVAQMNSLRTKSSDPKIGEVIRTDSEFIIPIYKYNPTTKLNDMTKETIKRIDSEGNPLPLDQVGQALSRILTPIKESWSSTLEATGGFSGAKPSTKQARGGSSQVAKIPEVSLTSLAISSPATGKKVGASAILAQAYQRGAVKTSEAMKQILTEALKSTGANIKVTNEENMTSSDKIFVDIDGKKTTFVFDSSTAADADGQLSKLINDRIAEANKKNFSKPVAAPSSSNKKLNIVSGTPDSKL